MTDTSDSEEFYDAEDSTPNRMSKKSRARRHSSEPKTEKPPTPQIASPENDPPLPSTEEPVSEDMQAPAAVVSENSNDGRKWFREMRQRMQTDDEEVGLNTSPPDSQTSSVDGVFAQPAAKTSHPFRIIEHDSISIQSLTSLGRVGRILGGTDNTGREQLASISGSVSTHSSTDTQWNIALSASARATQSAATTPAANRPPTPMLTTSQENVASGGHLQEPDVIASTKNSKVLKAQGDLEFVKPVPVAPPRKKKKNAVGGVAAPPASSFPTKQDVDIDVSTIGKGVMPLPSPASTIESLTRELEHSLDIQSARKGQYVVKPQDIDKNLVEESSQEDVPKQQLPQQQHIQQQSGEMKEPRQEKVPTYLQPRTSNSIGRSSINSAAGLSMSHFTAAGSGSGGSSLGAESIQYTTKLGLSPRNSKERRRSAGDEQGLFNQLNMIVRTRTDSGKQLSDLEILEQVTVLNLDTGERVPLSVAEDKLPQGINPLSLHIMRLTSEYVSTTSLESRPKESDDESVDSKACEGGKEKDGPGQGHDRNAVKKRTDKLKRFLGSTVKKTMDKAKSIAQEVSHSRHKDEGVDMVDDQSSAPGEQFIKLKASSSHKGPYDFDGLQQVQELSGEHQGPVWCMKFSSCGRLLATAGQDRVLRVWVLKMAYHHFQDIRTKYNAEKVSPTPSQESLVSQQSAEDPAVTAALLDTRGNLSPFMPKPFCKYIGHTSDLLDVSWSKNYFVLSSSMDKTVRLWHISRKECLCCFQHIDFVTAIVFHPRDDRYFLSGSLDGKLRLWNIPDKKVAVWNEVDGQTKLITAANFCQNGKFAVVGSYDGRCIFFNTDQLKYHTTIHVRSTRGKNATGRKISGIEPMPGEDKILVTSNDSRIRLYDLRDLNLSCKYKGYVNVSSQIKASFSHDGKYIISGSENQSLYIWKTNHDYSKFTSVRRDRNDFWEGLKAHNAVVTCAVFAPNPDSIIKELEARSEAAVHETTAEDPMVAQRTKGCGGYVLASADYNGCIKVFINKMKPKHSSLPASALA